MKQSIPADPRVEAWMTALDERHLANLTLPEVGRALRALSSCYVERRDRLAEGAALEGAGKRAAFALFYAPIHFLIARHLVRELGLGPGTRHILDLGCGTGSAGAAWALESPGATITGADRHPWAVAEASWTYRVLGVPGRGLRQDLTRAQLSPRPGNGIIAAYAINELPDDLRDQMLPRLLHAAGAGVRVLIVEPIARRMAPWWTLWEDAFRTAGGRADEWRFPPALPPRQRQLAKSAGLNPQELTARSLMAGPHRPAGHHGLLRALR